MEVKVTRKKDGVVIDTKVIKVKSDADKKGKKGNGNKEDTEVSKEVGSEKDSDWAL